MSDPVMKELLHNIAASKAITTAAVEQGIIIGRREMKPLIRELIAALENVRHAEWEYFDSTTIALINRARETLEND